MSVRAYKLIEIKTEKNPTFNCWNNPEVMDLAENTEQYNENGGILTFHDTEVIDELEKLKAKTKPTKKDKETIEIIKIILEDMDGENYLEYYCY